MDSPLGSSVALSVPEVRSDASPEPPFGPAGSGLVRGFPVTVSDSGPDAGFLLSGSVRPDSLIGLVSEASPPSGVSFGFSSGGALLLEFESIDSLDSSCFTSGALQEYRVIRKNTAASVSVAHAIAFSQGFPLWFLWFFISNESLFCLAFPPLGTETERLACRPGFPAILDSTDLFDQGSKLIEKTEGVPVDK